MNQPVIAGGIAGVVGNVVILSVNIIIIKRHMMQFDIYANLIFSF